MSNETAAEKAHREFGKRMQGDPDSTVFAAVAWKIDNGVQTYDEAIKFFDRFPDMLEPFKVFYAKHKGRFKE